MAVDSNSNSRKLKVFGFGIAGQGFYAMEIPEAIVKTSQTTGVLSILLGEATEEKLNRELKNLVKEDWDFKVKQMHLQEFLVVFPDKSSLETFAKLSSFEMPLYGLKGKLEKSELNPQSSSILQTIWVRIHNVPGIAREVESVKEMVTLVVEPLVVDELSLIRAGPVRVQGGCRTPSAINGSMEFFINGIGTPLRFEVEGPQGAGKGGKRGPPGPGKPGDKDGPRDNDRDLFPKGDKKRKGNGKFDRFGKIDKEVDSSHKGSME